MGRMVSSILCAAVLLRPPVVEYRTLTLPGPQRVHVATVDLTAPGVELLPVVGFDHLRARERPSDIGRRLTAGGWDVLAVANGDFGQPREGFGGPAHSPRSLFVTDGVLWNSGSPRAVFAIPRSGPPVIQRFDCRFSLRPEGGGEELPIESYNHWGDLERAALFGPEWTLSEERPANLTEVVLRAERPIRANEAVTMTVVGVDSTRGGLRLTDGHYALQLPRDGEDAKRFTVGQMWTLTASVSPALDLRAAIGGVPQILRDGMVDIRNSEEEISDDFVTARHPRTAYGLDREGKRLFLVVVDGRQPDVSLGVSLPELGTILKDLGAWTAMNMDGGGSSTLVVGGQVKNSPSDPSGERTTTSSLAVVRWRG